MERKIKFETGEFYHIYNRGVEKRVIFQDTKDYKRFLALLYIANSDKQVHISNSVWYKGALDDIFEKNRGNPLVAIGSYCLMPNHFHLLLTPLAQGGVSKFMLKLQTGYSMYFNKKNNRVGALFQGVFRSQHITDDIFLNYIFAYIHLNPAKLKNKNWKTQPKILSNELKKFIAEYPFSSLSEYISANHKILDTTPFPVDTDRVRNYQAIVDDFSEFIEGNP